MSKHDRFIKWYNRFMLILFVLVCLVAVYIMVKGIGTEGKDYGPGAYFYSDVPNWQEIYYPETVED